MQEFYNKALVSLLCIVGASFLIGYTCVDRTYLHLPLVPADNSQLPWHAEAAADEVQGGLSTIKINDDKFSLHFDFKIEKKVEHPFASFALVFTDAANEKTLVDLTQYDKLSFSTKCSPNNTLSLAIATFDEAISVRDNLLTYRAPGAFFSCSENWARIELDLTRLETPQWWFDMFKLDLSRQAYTLDKVSRITFSSTFQSPVNSIAEVQINELTLHGRDWRYMYLLGGFLLITWGSFAFWLFRQYTRALTKDLRDKIQRDRPLVAYQQLSVEPHRDKEKSAILRFMATEYANAELDLDTMVAAINVSRTKINDLLKAEMGYTFITYLNKLRLTEAARLLAEKEEANVAEIAYSVGYKNVSYFNKLFKEEYGCTPKTFKSLCNKDQPPQT